MGIVIKNKSFDNGLIQAMNALLSIKLPAITSFGITRLYGELEKCHNDYISTKTKLLMDHGAEKDENGNITLSEESPRFQEYLDQALELQEAEVVVDSKPVKLPLTTWEANNRQIDIEPSVLYLCKEVIEVV